MAKAIEFYTGNATFGAAVQMARREDGTYFSRAEERTRYGYGWSKWAPCVASFEGGAYSKVEMGGTENLWCVFDTPRAMYGFSPLHRHDDVPSVRLPNVDKVPTWENQQSFTNMAAPEGSVVMA